MPKRATIHPQAPVQERHQHQGGDGEAHREQVGRVERITDKDGKELKKDDELPKGTIVVIHAV